jgi:hypothetical protein
LKGHAAFGDSHMEGQTSPVVVGFKQMNVLSSLKKQQRRNLKGFENIGTEVPIIVNSHEDKN